MESTTKIAVSQTEIEDIVRGLLGRSALASWELTDGWFNTIYRIDLDDGERVVLKLAPPSEHPVMRYERNIMATEVAALTLLGEEHELPVPKVLAYDPTGRVHPHELFLMEYVPGDSYSSVRASLSDDERGRIDRELGRLSARIHEIPGTRFGRFREDHCTATGWGEALVAMVDDLFWDASDVDVQLPVEHPRLRDAFASAAEDLALVEIPSFVHWDLHPGNVFVDHGKVMGIIDCDRALWGDPLMEFMFREIGRMSDDFYVGYDEVSRETCAVGLLRSSSPSVAHRLWLYDLYLAMILVIECPFRGFDTQHRTWAVNHLTATFDRGQAHWK